MTKRLQAARHYHARHERHADPRFIPEAVRVFALLDNYPRLVPALATYPEFRCTACDVLIEPGQTAFQPVDTRLPYPTICYRCGISWELFNDRMTLDEAAVIPAIGGPSP